VWNKGDFSVLDTLIAPDADDHSTVGGQPKTEKGSASFRAIVSMFRAAMPDIQLTIDDEVFAGDKVVHRWHLVGTDTGGVMGMPPSGQAAHLLRHHDRPHARRQDRGALGERRRVGPAAAARRGEPPVKRSMQRVATWMACYATSTQGTHGWTPLSFTGRVGPRSGAPSSW
jgi:hypothetical protein